MKQILLLSDTHAYIDDSILKHASECDELWHAGDVGSVALIDALEACCVVRGVYGNVDDADVRLRFKQFARFECEGMKILMTHIGGYPGNYYSNIRAEIQAYKPDIFISGHSHILKVMHDDENSLLHLNPGAIGVQGFHHVRTMLRFVIENGKPRDMAVIEYPKRVRNQGYL